MVGEVYKLVRSPYNNFCRSRIHHKDTVNKIKMILLTLNRVDIVHRRREYFTQIIQHFSLS